MELATLIRWQPEYEVTLPFGAVDEMLHIRERQLIPDATLTGTNERFFIEVDRSTETLRRCRQVLENYQRATEHPGYAERFPDGLPAHVVYLTKSKKRAGNLSAVCEDFGSKNLTGSAFPMDEGIEFLRTRALNIAPPRSPRQRLAHAHDVLRRLYEDSLQVHRALMASGQVSALSPSLQEAYEYLCSESTQGT